MFEEKRIRIIRRVLYKQEKEVNKQLHYLWDPGIDPTCRRQILDDVYHIKSDALGKIRQVCAVQKLESLEQLEENWF